MTAGLDTLNYQDKSKIFDFKKMDYSEEITKQRIVENNPAIDTNKEEKDKKENLKESDFKKSDIENKQSEGKSSEVLDPSNYEEISEFAIELIDLGMSSLAKFISKEKGSSHKFEAPAHKKAKLSRQLSKILNKHNLGISIEFIFIISLVMIYLGPIREAIKLRGENIEKEKQKELQKEISEKRKQEMNQQNNQNSENKKEEVIEVITEEIPQRRSGRPSKEEQERKRQKRNEVSEDTFHN
jgi:hypothetical protein